MFSLPGTEIHFPLSISNVQEIFKSACKRRGLRQNSNEAQELSRAMLAIYALGFGDSRRLRNLANFYP
jgi:hypothetical protein